MKAALAAAENAKTELAQAESAAQAAEEAASDGDTAQEAQANVAEEEVGRIQRKAFQAQATALQVSIIVQHCNCLRKARLIK